ncbi:GNAT family N-acetyltransferase [Lacticaseibacillus kribbianus]|uniref:GNAT family N-acetyltransferase n=1 Tax=Lacticaseibacillus kribbianus TaxID=2926292 RepID=UPI001CD52F44|nr:GNAT family N-acetyltransferase [Lacticaseibacillus kribbianus]
MFTITQTAVLTADQIKAAQTLTEVVQAHDHLARAPYLDNQFNVDRTMPAFFMAWAAGELIGYATLYADEAPGGCVDVALYMHPAWRRRGVATALWQAAGAVLAGYGYEDYEFLCEQAFLDRNPGFLAAAGLAPNGDAAEYQLCAPAGSGAPMTGGLSVRRMTADDVLAVLPLYAAAFPEDEASADLYLTQTLAGANSRAYLLLDGATPLGYAAVDTGAGYPYLFGVFIAADRRGAGLGTRFVRALLARLSVSGPVRLSVEADNPAACRAYAKAGFVRETTVWYLVPTGAAWRLPTAGA